MRKLFIFIVIIVTAIWFFYSWDFYTCKIKGFCNGIIKKDKIVDNDKIIHSIIDNEEIKKDIKKIIKKEQINTGETEKVLTNTGEIKKEVLTKKEIKKCKKIITLPIKYGSDSNNSLEVKALERFLNEIEGANLEINGIYEKNDYDEVKKFQLKYHEDILDPWEIKNPTGYVYNTTIKKINEVYCLNIK